MGDKLRDISQSECREYIDLYTTYAGRAERAEAEVERLNTVLVDMESRLVEQGTAIERLRGLLKL